MFVFVSPALFRRQHRWNFRATYGDLSFQRLVFPLANISCCWLEAWNLHQLGLQQQTFSVLCVVFHLPEVRTYHPGAPCVTFRTEPAVCRFQSTSPNAPCASMSNALPETFTPSPSTPLSLPPPPNNNQKTTNQPTNNKKIKPKHPPSSSFVEVSIQSSLIM